METRRVHEVVHTLRQKPVHVRESIAVGIALVATLLVAGGWLAANASAGTFAFGTTDTASAGDAGQTVTSTQNNLSQLLGAAGAAIGATSSPATITVVDTQVHSTLDAPQVPADQTVIHF